jgi:hypothetical protein
LSIFDRGAGEGIRTLHPNLGRGIVDVCVEVLGVPERTVLVEFTVHAGDEMLRDGDWVKEWTDAEASAGAPNL